MMKSHTPTLSGKKNFQQLFEEGRSLVSRELVLYIKANQRSGNLVAFCVGKTVGNAVERNTLRRRMREAFRLWQDRIEPGYTLAWVGRARTKAISFQELSQVMAVLLKRAKLLLNDGDDADGR